MGEPMRAPAFAFEPTTALTFEQKVTAAYLHFVRGINQQDIAIAMGGVNNGRVNEAVRAIANALGRNTPETEKHP
jgi:hypothetical protein